MTHEERARAARASSERTPLRAPALYYVVTGVWPLVHYRSFETITGPKVDTWLVRTFGVLVTVVGAALALAVARGRVTDEVRVLAAGSALALAACDVYYVTRGRIRPTYLGDAALEVALAEPIVLAARRGPR